MTTHLNPWRRGCYVILPSDQGLPTPTPIRPHRLPQMLVLNFPTTLGSKDSILNLQNVFSEPVSLRTITSIMTCTIAIYTQASGGHGHQHTAMGIRRCDGSRGAAQDCQYHRLWEVH